MGILSSLFSDPVATLTVLLLALPGRLLAICCHEAAHGWVANKCGDPTAKMMGRVTLNPLKHLDPLGIICMLLLGIGWAKPVPVNPRNFRNPRRDDLLVSLAGITMNLILFLIGCIVLYIVLAIALLAVPVVESLSVASDFTRTTVDGTAALISGQYWYDIADLLHYGVSLEEILITPAFGTVGGYLYQMLAYFISTNLCLAIFNLIPIPPLDGYHVLNDTVLRRKNLFASQKWQRIGIVVLYLAMFSGILSTGLSWVFNKLMYGFGDVAFLIYRAVGLI